MATYLVDFENVRSDDLIGVSRLDEDDRVILFYSEKADKISIGLHRRILESKAVFEYRKADVGAKDALDFQLVTYLGFLIAANGSERYCLVSNDHGFDYAANFWRRQKYDVRLMPSIVPLSKVDRPDTQTPAAPVPAPVSAPAPQDNNPGAQDPCADADAPLPSPVIPEAEAPATEAFSATAEDTAQAVSPAVPTLPPEPIPESDESAPTAPRTYRSRDNRRSSRQRNSARAKAPAVSTPAPATVQVATAEEPQKPEDGALQSRVTALIGPDTDAEVVTEYILRYKSKLGINNALVKKYGNTKGGEIYKKIKSLIADKKGN